MNFWQVLSGGNLDVDFSVKTVSANQEARVIYELLHQSDGYMDYQIHDSAPLEVAQQQLLALRLTLCRSASATGSARWRTRLSLSSRNSTRLWSYVAVGLPLTAFQ